jgi:hypothetical protein
MEKIQRGKELRHIMKEWRYNGDNKDPQEDLGNDKMLVIL